MSSRTAPPAVERPTPCLASWLRSRGWTSAAWPRAVRQPTSHPTTRTQYQCPTTQTSHNINVPQHGHHTISMSHNTNIPQYQHCLGHHHALSARHHHHSHNSLTHSCSNGDTLLTYSQHILCYFLLYLDSGPSTWCCLTDQMYP